MDGAKVVVKFVGWAKARRVSPIVEPNLGREGGTKSEIQKGATGTGRRNAPKTAVCFNFWRAADATQ
jgi:hypothetical protein